MCSNCPAIQKKFDAKLGFGQNFYVKFNVQHVNRLIFWEKHALHTLNDR
jgi:hypothetical protein